MNATVRVTVEFLGVPRLRAGRPELFVQAATAAEALTEVERVCPELDGLVGQDGRLSSLFLLAVDGRPFLTDLHGPLRTGQRLLLLSADAGG